MTNPYKTSSLRAREIYTKFKPALLYVLKVRFSASRLVRTLSMSLKGYTSQLSVASNIILIATYTTRSEAFTRVFLISETSYPSSVTLFYT